MGVAYDFNDEEPHITVDLEVLGDDLTLGIERIDGQNIGQLTRQLQRLVENHRKREATRVHAMEARASGWITQAALGIIDSAGLDRAATIPLIQGDGEVGITLGGPDCEELLASLFQIDGVILGSILPRNRGWRLGHDDLTIWGEGMPETLRGSLLGRRLGELFQNRELPGDAVIASVEDATSVDPEADDDGVDGWLRLGIEIPVAEIDEATGDVRDVVRPVWTRIVNPGVLSI